MESDYNSHKWPPKVKQIAAGSEGNCQNSRNAESEGTPTCVVGAMGDVFGRAKYFVYIVLRSFENLGIFWSKNLVNGCYCKQN